MAFVPKNTPDELRQVDAGHLLALTQRGATALFAVELGIDPVRAVDFDFSRFSAHNHWHGLAADARSLATHFVSTGLNVPVGELAVALGLQKQVVSRLVHQGEDLSDNRVAARVIARVNQIYGIAG